MNLLHLIGRIVSLLSLAAIPAAALGYFKDVITLPQTHSALLVATFIWFLTAISWRHRGAKNSVQEQSAS